jgi:hypothetical protein
MARILFGLAFTASWLASACLHAASAQPLLGDATSGVNLICNSAQGPSGSFAEPVSFSCEGHPTIQTEVGATRARASTAFGELLQASAATECVGCPFCPSTLADGRIRFQFAVQQHAAPPRALETVPVLVETSGEAGVSVLGYGAGGGTFLSSTPQDILLTSDVFREELNTFSPSSFEDSFAVTATLDLTPGHVYFGHVIASCNQSSSQSGSWSCGTEVRARFALDQAAFDASEGEQSFELAQHFALVRSPNLVPEPSSAGLGAAALAALAAASGSNAAATRRARALLRRRRQWRKRSPHAADHHGRDVESDAAE